MVAKSVVNGVIIIAAIGISITNHAKDKREAEEHRMQVAATYNLSPEAADFAKSCVSTMALHDAEFSEGSSNIWGCSCVANQWDKSPMKISTQGKKDIYRGVVRIALDNDESAFTDIERVVAEEGLSMEQSVTMVEDIVGYLGYCGENANTMSDYEQAVPEEKRAEISLRRDKKGKSATQDCSTYPDNVRTQIEQIGKERGQTFNWDSCQFEG